MVPAALQHYNEGGHELAINASKTKRRKRKEKRMAPFRQLRHHEVAKEVSAPTSALPTTQQSTPSPATSAGENGTTSRNAEVEVTAPRKIWLQRRCADPRDRAAGTCKFPRRRCKLSFAEIIGESGTRCPQDDWVNAMVKVDPDPDKVIMNVGCNKGHDSIAWLQRFDQHRFWNLRKWSSLLATHKSVCSLSRIPKPPPYPSDKAPVALCVEAIPSTVALLKETRHLAGYGVKRSRKLGTGWLKFWWRAMTDKARPGETVEFLNESAGKESARMGATMHKPNATRIQVPLSTVDSIVGNLGLPKVDILIVDTEGADPAVLRGAENALKTVRYLMFETHRDLKRTAWSSTSIHAVVSDLSGRGFDCYWAGANGRLTSITLCYHTSFEKIGWGNIACVKRGDVWWQVMDRFDPNAHFRRKPAANVTPEVQELLDTLSNASNVTEALAMALQKEETLSEAPSNLTDSAVQMQETPEGASNVTQGKEEVGYVNSTNISILMPDASGKGVEQPLKINRRCADPRNRQRKGCHFPLERCRLPYNRVISNGTICPWELWSNEMVRADPDPDKVILNIGCNKGLDSIAWLQRFDQQRFWKLRKWSEMISGDGDVACPLETKIRKPPKMASNATPMAVCVEAMPLTTHLLKERRHAAGWHATAAFGTFTILQRAVSDVSSPNATTELMDPTNTPIRVPLSSVDTLVQKLNLSKVDILILRTRDSEAVLRGAEETLRSVRYLMFEVRGTNSTWSNRSSVYEVVSRLNYGGFECYWAGANGNLSSITSCYESFFERLGVGNIACVKRDDVWWQVLDKYDPNTLAQ